MTCHSDTLVKRKSTILLVVWLRICRVWILFEDILKRIGTFSAIMLYLNIIGTRGCIRYSNVSRSAPTITTAMHLILRILCVDCRIIKAQIVMRRDVQFDSSVPWHFYLKPVYLISIIIIQIAQMSGDRISPLQQLGILPRIIRLDVVQIGRRGRCEVILQRITSLPAIMLHFKIISSFGTVIHSEHAIGFFVTTPTIATAMHLVIIIFCIQGCIIESQVTVRNDSHLHRTIFGDIYLIPIHLIGVGNIQIAKMTRSICVIRQRFSILPGIVRLAVIRITV